MTLSRLLILAFILLSALSAQAVTYYVATTGSNTNCTTIQTAGTPALTINFALDCFATGATAAAGAGHTVQVAAGTYSEAINNNIPSGSGAGSPFILKCVTALACTLTGRNSQGEVLAWSTSGYTAQWIIVDGFILDGSSVAGSDGVRFSAYNSTNYQNITLQNLKIQNMGDFGILGGSGNHITIRNVTTANLCVTHTKPNQCHSIYVGGYGNNWIIEHSHLTGHTGYGVHAYSLSSSPYPTNLIVRHSRIFGSTSRGSIITYGSGHTIYNNVLYNNAADGIEVKVAAGVQIINNTIYGNKDDGISVAAGATVVCANNLIVGNGTAIEGTCTTNTTNRTSGTPIDLMIDPANGDFNLKEASAAINAGTSIAASGKWPGSFGRFVGSAPDQGAFEAPVRFKPRPGRSGQ